jgi:DNA-binding IclR family transcriptional regulator
MRAVGFLDQEAGRGSHRLGLRLFGLGTAAITNLPLHREAAPFVDALREELAAIRARGWAIDDRGHEADLCCVAAPIRNAAGCVLAAVGTSSPPRGMAARPLRPVPSGSRCPRPPPGPPRGPGNGWAAAASTRRPRA